MNENEEEIVYQHGDYIERVIDEQENARLVFCSGDGVRPLYRLETDDENLKNTVYFTLSSAMDHFDLVAM